jgi:hypothetical protein
MLKRRCGRLGRRSCRGDTMPESPSHSGEARPSWADHLAVLLGGVLGGGAGLTFVELWLVPGGPSLFHLETLQCCGLGVVIGYLPGIGTCWAALQVGARGSARPAGILAATASAALLCGFVAAIVGAAAHV